MARYYASIYGNRGIVTRTGSSSSGIHGHIRGWNIGVKVDCHPDPDNPKRDVCEVYETGGKATEIGKRSTSPP